MSKARNILLIDDNVNDILVFKNVLANTQGTYFEITEVNYLQEAIKLANIKKFDVVVLDLSLPDSSGLSTLSQFKCIHNKIPIIIYTELNCEEFSLIAVKSGAQDYIAKGTINTHAIGRTINHAIERHALLMALEDSQKHAHKLATCDALTGLKNRYSFNESLVNQIYQSKRNNTRFSILFLDLDRFKNINDSLGHSTGDLLLIEVSKRLTNTIRQTDMISRFGGDEFVILLNDLAESNMINKICHSLIDALTAPFLINKQYFFIGCSIGVAVYPLDGSEHDILIKNSDAAMYAAKDAGRNCVKFYSSELNEKAFQKMSFETDLRFAIEHKNFSLVYQPIYDAKTNKVLGVEALVRWQKADGTTVLPSAFIKIAEGTGLIIPLGNYVLKEACKQQVDWKKRGYAPGFVSVNVSAKQFENEEFFLNLCQIIEETGISPSDLQLELTEHAIMTDVEFAILILKLIKSLGVSMAIDDFGTGYSSLKYLIQFPIDTLKIDQSFIQNINRSKKDLALIEGIIILAKQLGMSTTAEGVETQEQINSIKKLTCDRLQGFYLSKPIGENEIKMLLKQNQDTYSLTQNLVPNILAPNIKAC